MDLNLFNLIILVGAVHGILLSVLLIISDRNRRQGNLLLALMLVFYSLPMMRVVLIDIGIVPEFGGPFASIELLYGLGPSLYLYSLTTADPSYDFRRTDLIHFLPVALEIVYYFSPLYRENDIRVFMPMVDFEHLVWMIEQTGACLSILLYLALTNRLLLRHANWVANNYSNMADRTLNWLATPILLYTAFFILWFGMRMIDIVAYEDQLTVVPYYPFLAFLSLSTYWIGTKGYLTSVGETTKFSDRKKPSASRVAEHAVLAALFENLETYCRLSKPYLDEELTLAQLAEGLNAKPRLLSEAINSCAGVNFYEYVNRFRVEEFKRRLRDYPSKRPLLILAFECGFGSKATFNHVFKKAMGVTPTQYRKRLLSPSSKE